MRSDVLRQLFQAGNPIIAIETPDEPRATAAVCEIAQQLRMTLLEWSVTDGLVAPPPAPSRPLVEPGKVAAALRYVSQSANPAIYLFKDLSPHCKDPQVARSLRDLYFSPDSRPWTLVLIDALRLPPELRRLAVPFDVGWPAEEEMRKSFAAPSWKCGRRALSRSNPS